MIISFGVSVVEISGEWKAIDGKELVGNIDSDRRCDS